MFRTRTDAANSSPICQSVAVLDEPRYAARNLDQDRATNIEETEICGGLNWRIGMKKECHKLPVVEPRSGDHPLAQDQLAKLTGTSPWSELVCGRCGTVLLPDFTVEDAQHSIVGQTGRTLAKCPTCFAHNLLSAQ